MRILLGTAVVAMGLAFAPGAAEAGKFCVKRGIFPEPNTWVRIGSCRPQGGGCITLPRLDLRVDGGYVCGVHAGVDMNRRFSFPHGGRRIRGVARGGAVYFD